MNELGGLGTESERQSLLEAAFNPGTQRWLANARVPERGRCLAVGAGTQTTAGWLQAAVGREGVVATIDTSARSWCQASTDSPQTSAPEVQALAAEKGPFDLVHVRFVLGHAPDRADILAAIVEVVKPGGLLMVEEPDFGCARVLAGPDHLRRSFNAIHSAIELVFATLNLDHALGSRVPALLEEHRFGDISIENDAPIVPGGSPVASVMAMSANLFATAYVATAFATLNDIVRYREFASEPTCWATYAAIVRGVGRRPIG